MARIIIADDDEIVGELVCNALIDAGHSAGLLTNGRDALRFIRARAPDLAILDCNMPELGGLIVLRAMRQSPAQCHTPVMILTGRCGDKDVELARFDGADDYMKKPFDTDELVARVEALLANRRKPDRPVVRPSARRGFGRLNVRA